MRRRLSVLAFVLVFVFVGTVGFGERRASMGSTTMTVSAAAVGQCQGFTILTDYVALWRTMDLVDKDGNPKMGRLQIRVIGESLYYNSEDPAKAVAGGPGEVTLMAMNPATGLLHGSGLVWKVRIPGHGLVFAETGQNVFQCDPYTFENCQAVSNTGHNQFQDQDLAALCTYLQ